MDKHRYQVSLKWKEGRQGILSSTVLPTTIEVATPPEFDHGVPGIWSPEHLFTSSVLSCFMTTFFAIAEYSKIEYDTFECDAEGILDKVDGKFMMTEINLTARVKIPNLELSDKVERILQKSETACLISNSIKSKVNLTCHIN